ncbi:hypothetical protein [Bacillus sp. CDB3]|uniref:hypothetical protein n=1 Tax=Bacillus sp. CDB3 TaxID=360310 RepID=UPI0009D8F603|nr:hypothetical protein [Bacillus sp. CDB3]OQR56578.1 hypothetical protein CDB3_12065 [Bacillus sp. CDB3]
MSKTYFIEDLYDLSFEQKKDLLKLFVSENETLCFFYAEENLKSLNNKEKKMVLTNLYEKSQKWIVPLGQVRELKGMMWYKVKIDEEIIQAIEIEQLFWCVIVKDGYPVKDFSYSFALIEDDCIEELVIEEKEKNSFINKVCPKIREMFGEKLKIS